MTQGNTEEINVNWGKLRIILGGNISAGRNVKRYINLILNALIFS